MAITSVVSTDFIDNEDFINGVLAHRHAGRLEARPISALPNRPTSATP